MQPDHAETLAAHEDVLQAEGFVALQLGVDVDRAAEVMALYAGARGLGLPQVARDVLQGRVTFGAGG